MGGGIFLGDVLMSQREGGINSLKAKGESMREPTYLKLYKGKWTDALDRRSCTEKIS